MTSSSPAVEVGHAVRAEPAGYGAAEACARAALSSVRVHRPSALLVFSSVRHDLGEVLRGVRDAAGDAPVLGASTAGEIHDGEHRGSVVVTALASPFLSVRVGAGEDVSRDWRAALDQAVSAPGLAPYFDGSAAAWAELAQQGKAAFAILFSPGSTRDSDSRSHDILEALKRRSLGRLPIFGASSATERRGDHTFVLTRERALADGVLVAVFETALRFGLGVAHGFRATAGDGQLTATAVRGNEVLEFDHRCAAEAYASLLGASRAELEGKHVTLATGALVGTPDPLGYHLPNVASYFTPGGGVRFARPVSPGAVMTRLRADAETASGAGREALAKAMMRAETARPAVALASYCALRPALLGDAARAEIPGMAEALGGVPLVGLHSFGEQGPSDDGVAQHTSAVIATLVIGTELSRTAELARENEALRREAEVERRRTEAELERLVAERTQELRAASESLHTESAERRRAEATARRQQRALEALGECNEALVRATDEDALLGAVCRIVVEVGGYLMSWVGLAEHDERKTVRPVARAGRDEGYLSNVDVVWADTERGRGPAGTAVRTGKPAIARDVLRDEKLTLWHDEIARRGYASLLSLPLATEGVTFGVLSIYSGDVDSFDDEEIALLARLAGNLAFGVVALRGREERARLTAQLEADHRDLGRMMSLFAKGEARTSAVIENAIDGIVLLAAGGRIQGLNRAAEEILGWARDEVVGRDFVAECIAPRSRHAVAESLALDAVRGTGPRQPARREVYGWRRGGREFPLECSFAPLQMSAGSGFCAFLRDLTESRRLELELQQAQKLEAVGQLAAGIAHEINTPIQFIGDNTRFLEDAFRELLAAAQRYRDALSPERAEEVRRFEEEADVAYLHEEIPRTIERTLRGVDRVATIVRAMKEFAHPDEKDMVACDLNRSIEATLEISRNEYKYVADVEVDLGELPLVTCHAGDLNQVFLNIIVNAAHAVADVVKGTPDRGRIRVQTRRDGAEAVVTISDTGDGIPESIRDKIFDPFFTTKPVGRGTGQGLAIARNIVAKHRGSIRFETEPGRGTTFFVRVPLGEEEAAPRATAVR